MFNYIIWDPNPIVFQIGSYAFRWYGIMWGLGVMAAWLFLSYTHHYEKKDNRLLIRLMEYLFFSGIIGARLGQIIFYELNYFIQNPLEIFMIWKGGLASHGGGIGLLVGAYLFARKYSQYTFWWIIDRVVVVLCLSVGLVRIGNLLNSEIVGKASNLPWAFHFVQYDGPQSLIYRHPSPLYETLMVFGIFALLLYLYHKSTFRQAGKLTGLFFVLAFSGRILLEFFKEDALWTQMLSVPFVLCGLYLLFSKTPTVK